MVFSQSTSGRFLRQVNTFVSDSLSWWLSNWRGLVSTVTRPISSACDDQLHRVVVHEDEHHASFNDVHGVPDGQVQVDVVSDRVSTLKLWRLLLVGGVVNHRTPSYTRASVRPPERLGHWAGSLPSPTPPRSYRTLRCDSPSLGTSSSGSRSILMMCGGASRERHVGWHRTW
jgi:hypothetical protein